MDNCPPDIKYEVWLVPHGYEVSITYPDGTVFSQARDFAESLDIVAMREVIYAYLKSITDRMEELYKANPEIVKEVTKGGQS
jgi:hypothetical protein